MTTETRHTWQNVRDIIRNQILDSTYAPGDKLPKDEEIAERIGCGRTTVQRAMRELSESGLVIRKRKGGTNVRPYPLTRATFDIPVTREEVEANGANYAYHLIERNLKKAPLNVAAKFKISKKVDLLHVEAIHLSDGRPFIYEDRWISIQAVPKVLDVNFEVQSANEWLIQNKPYDLCNLRFFAERASDYYKGIFETDENDALFAMERMTWLDEVPITLVKAVCMPGYSLNTTA